MGLIAPMAGYGADVFAAAPSTTLESRFEAAVRARGNLPEAAVVTLNDMRVSGPSDACHGSALQRLDLPRGEDGLGRVSARAWFANGDSSATMCWVHARVEVVLPTLVLAHDLTRGEPITAGDLTFELLPMTRHTVCDSQRVMGRVLRRAMRRGELLREDLLQAADVVQRGDRVQASILRGVLKLTTAATALSRGAVGEEIRIRTLAADRVLTARVVDPNTVEIVQ